MDRRALRRLCLFLALFNFLRLSRTVAETWNLSQEEEIELEKQLKSLNKPYVRTFKDEYGIRYDCVDMYKQAAFDHPLLKNHTLQLKFQGLPQDIVEESSSVFRFPRRCPKGTVLIRRTTKEDLIRAKKRRPRTKIIQPTLNHGTGDGNHYAGVAIDAPKGQKFYGVTANSEVYQLSGVSDKQASTSLITLTKGESGPKKYYNYIQTGWQVDAIDEGDGQTHFFTYWTSDGLGNTGCVNLQCPGFVQGSDSITPGMVFKDANLPLTILRDATTLNWLLYHNGESHLIGYWPKEIFNNMRDATQVQIGGVVHSEFSELSPPMGNGEINGAKFSNICLIDGHRRFILVPPDSAKTFQDLGRPYYDTDYNNITPGELKYGGPGGW